METLFNVCVIAIAILMLPALSIYCFRAAYAGEGLGILIGLLLATASFFVIVGAPREYRLYELFLAVPGMVVAFASYHRPLEK